MMKRIISIFVVMASWLPGIAGIEPRSAFDTDSGESSVAADGSCVGAASGLPTRIIQHASRIVLVLVPAREFQMGSPVAEADRLKNERQHLRIISQPFYIGETEVTVEQFRRFVQATRYQTDAERGVEEGGHNKGAFASTP